MEEKGSENPYPETPSRHSSILKRSNGDRDTIIYNNTPKRVKNFNVNDGEYKKF